MGHKSLTDGKNMLWRARPHTGNDGQIRNEEWGQIYRQI